MKEEKKESPIGVLWGWGKLYHGKFIGSIIGIAPASYIPFKYPGSIHILSIFSS